jgi:predicted ribosome quality control (RQC) complex YloA/Tae2 family protein
MHFDAITLAAVAAELNEVVTPGRVQNVVLPDERSIGLEIYGNRQRRYLLASAHPQASRVHLVEHKLRRGVEKTSPLLLLLRKYVRGGLLESVEQPVPYERVLFLRFEHPEHGSTTLVVEPMGRLSNLLLLDAGDIILDALVRVPPGSNPLRVILPRRPYTLPPPQQKLSPLDNGDPGYYDQLRRALNTDAPLWKALVANVEGVSPTLGREIAWRATGDANTSARAVDALPVVQALQEIWCLPQNGDWEPGVVADDQGKIIAFAPYELHFLGTFYPVDGISQAVEQFFGAQERDAAGTKDPYAGLRNNVAALIRRSEERVQRQLAGLAEDEPAPGEPERLRVQAEWLLALASQIEPGQEVLTVELEDGKSLTIPLSSSLSPVEQAERWFDRAAKLERAAQVIPERRRRLEADLAFLAQLRTDLALAGSQPEIAAVQEELRNAGFLRQRAKHRAQKPGRDVAKPMRFVSPDGFTILVGRNARQNEIVTFQEASGDDLWLHVRDVPGAHVVVRCGGQVAPPDTLHMAACLAAYYSSKQGEKAVPVAVTRRRFVTRMAGGRPGQVHYRNEETLTVPAELPEA